MQKLTRRLSLVMVALMVAFIGLSYVPTASAATVVPQVQFAADQKTEFVAGERITFNLNAANYGGRVQYRVVLWNDATKSYSDLWNTADRYYANWQPYGNETLPLGWVINEPGSYRITVYVKRAGLANNLTAIPTANCDSYQAGPAFTVKPAFVGTALEAYEKAPLTTLAEVVAAEALKAPAADSVAKVTDATLKATLDARMAAADKKVADAREKLAYVHVESVKAVAANKIKVTFDKEVTAAVKNFNVYEKDDVYAVNFIEKVTVDKNVAYVYLYDTLATKTTYVVNVKDVKSADAKLDLKEATSKEIEYSTSSPVKIAFAATTVTLGDPVEYVITDAEGNDITSDYADAEIEIQTSAAGVVDNDLTTDATGYSVVNVILPEYELETGNTIIKVVTTQAKLTSIGDYTTNGDLTDPVNYVYESTTDGVLAVEILDQDGEDFGDWDTVTFKSLNPSVLLVDQDGETGNIIPLSAGTASVLVTVVDGTTTIRKTISVQVKADPEATSLKVSAATAKLVRDANYVTDVTVEVIDQYGNVLDVSNTADTAMTYTIDKTGIAYTVQGSGNVEMIKNSSLAPHAYDADLVNGEATITLLPYDKDNTDGVNGTGKITVSYDGLKAYVTVTQVAPGTFAGYAATITGAKLDLNAADPDLADGDASATITVYEKDTNGNYTKKVTSGVTVDYVSEKDYVNIADQTITPAKVGTESVVVKVGDVKVATFALTVVNTTKKVTTVTQVKENVQISLGEEATLFEKLFGTTASGAAFVGYDQYGSKRRIVATDIAVAASDNTAAVAVSTDPVTGKVTNIAAVDNGIATITMKIAGKFYTITIKVVD